MANRKSESKKQVYKFVYEGINQSDDVLRSYSEEVLETIFTGSTMQVGDTMNDQDISSFVWTDNITKKYFGRNTSDTNSEFYETIWDNQQRAYNTRMASEWSTFMDGVKEENPGLYQWIQNDLKNADDVAGRKEQINMVYGPWVANERVALSNHVDVNQLSSRVWQQGAINQGKIEQIVRDGIALGEPRHETYSKLNEWLNPDYAPAIFGEDGIVRRLPGDPNASSAARRLMRTETAKATGMAEIDASLTIPSIIGTEWALASRHPMYDICDERATDDLYDLGPGIYEPGKVPPYPPHPNCMCALINLHLDEEDAHLAMVNEARAELGLPPLSESDLNRIADQEWLYETPDFGIVEQKDLQTGSHKINPDQTIDDTQIITDNAYGPDIKEAMSIYQGNNDYPLINTMMREDMTVEEAITWFEREGVRESWLNYWRGNLDEDPLYYTKVIQRMDVATHTFTTDRPTVVYRGTPRAYWIDEDLGIGSIFSDEGFISTSHDPEIAENFAMNHFLEIHLPEDSPFALVPEDRSQWIVDTGAPYGEREVLLPRNTKFRIIDINDDHWTGVPHYTLVPVEDD